MKNLSICIGIFVILSACNPLQKMVDKGNYDKAVIVAARKMAGDKTKKTKHVKVLEEAFIKIMASDLARAQNLEDRGGLGYLESLNIYRDIANRQSLVEPYLPLISEDGYRADIKFVKTQGLIANASQMVGKYYYEKGRDLLNHARSGDKSQARRAYHLLSEVSKYVEGPYNLESLIDEAFALGITHVYVNVRNEAQVYMPRRFEDAIVAISVHDLNSQWRRYYLNHPSGQNIDVNATLILNHIMITPERERVDRFVETQEVKDGWEYVLNRHGEVKLDSLGHQIKKETYTIAKAKVRRINRSKEIQIGGTIRYTDAHTGEPIRVQPITVNNAFLDSACRVDGDLRAITRATKQCSREILDPFPSDHDLAMIAASEIKGILKSDLNNYLY